MTSCNNSAESCVTILQHIHRGYANNEENISEA